MKDYPRDVDQLAQAIMDRTDIETSGSALPRIYQAFDHLLVKDPIDAEDAKILAGCAMLIKTHHLTNRQEQADNAYDKAFPLLEDVPEPEPEPEVESDPE